MKKVIPEVETQNYTQTTQSEYISRVASGNPY